MYRNETGKPIYVNRDRSKVVEAGSPEAAFLLIGPGGELSDEDATKYGLTAKAASSEAAADKEAAPPPADKGRPGVPRRTS